MINHTVPHEVAHLFSQRMKPEGQIGSVGHGPVWRKCMQDLGLEPLRCHAYGPIINETTKSYEYRCHCGVKFNFSQEKHNNVQIRGARYFCKKCNNTCVWEHSNQRSIPKDLALSQPRKRIIQPGEEVWNCNCMNHVLTVGKVRNIRVRGLKYTCRHCKITLMPGPNSRYPSV